MREIKFRAWHESDGGVMLFVGDLYGTTHPMDCCKYHIEGQPVTLMQYTGLRDCNGVEIYEGDIIRHTVYEMPYDETSPKTFRIGVVEYLAENMAFSTNNNPYVCDQEQGIESARMEVIGNIYEHPHLMESGE